MAYHLATFVKNEHQSNWPQSTTYILEKVNYLGQQQSRAWDLFAFFFLLILVFCLNIHCIFFPALFCRPLQNRIQRKNHDKSISIPSSLEESSEISIKYFFCGKRTDNIDLNVLQRKRYFSEVSLSTPVPKC